jgi:hypothetical protein
MPQGTSPLCLELPSRLSFPGGVLGRCGPSTHPPCLEGPSRWVPADPRGQGTLQVTPCRDLSHFKVRAMQCLRSKVGDSADGGLSVCAPPAPGQPAYTWSGRAGALALAEPRRDNPTRGQRGDTGPLAQRKRSSAGLSRQRNKSIGFALQTCVWKEASPPPCPLCAPRGPTLQCPLRWRRSSRVDQGRLPARAA